MGERLTAEAEAFARSQISDDRGALNKLYGDMLFAEIDALRAEVDRLQATVFEQFDLPRQILDITAERDAWRDAAKSGERSCAMEGCTNSARNWCHDHD